MSFSPTHLARFARGALLAAAAWMAPLAGAQSLADTHVTGQFVGVDDDGTVTEGTFDCKGEPTCTGSYQATDLEVGCTNAVSLAGSITLTGLDLSHAGPLVVDATLGGIDHNHITNTGGVCAATGTGTDNSVELTGGWDGTQGAAAATVPDNNGRQLHVAFSFTATRNPPPPVFPMTVITNITATSASATAQFQPRPEDVGKSESVFVFAHAPASLVAGAKRVQADGAPSRNADGGDPCVLAQVGPSGQLIPASASTMTAAFTQVLGTQGQSVTLLNNVPTPGVAGATVFTGYGTNSGAMLSSGVYQGAVTVPGSVSCGTILNASVTAQSPGALSGLWYNASESGWGIYFSQRAAKVFVAWYTYDAAGKPKWYVSPLCAMAAGGTATSGTCNGDLFEVSGPGFFGVAFDPSREHVAAAGSLQVRFTDANNASFTYTAAGQTRTVAIARQLFGSASPVAVDFTDLWYNAAESGWGMAVTHQFANMFLAWFVYDAAGNPIWYVSPDCTVSGNSCAGSLYRTTGPPFGPTFVGPATPFLVGTVKLDFTGPNDGTVTYTVDGVSGTKPIQRQVF